MLPSRMRLGISKIKVELDDLSLKYLKPDVYYDLVEKVALRKSAREEFVNSYRETGKAAYGGCQYQGTGGWPREAFLQHL